MEKLSDDELKAQTAKFKERIKTALAEFDQSPEGHEDSKIAVHIHSTTYR
jgi:preprotein translocase subunit SecA